MKKTISTYSPIAAAVAGLFMLTACSKSADITQTQTAKPDTTTEQTLLVDESRLSIYHGVDLTSDLSHL
ncbi:MAG: Zn-dependent hydrolase, partial [Alteromonas sp.]|nr:Zn-dependent hydrolase [Alteromonas sp.]